MGDLTQPPDGIAQLVARIQARRTLPPPDRRRSIREAVGASQPECARALGVSRQGFAHWETGRRTPKGEHLDAYADLLRALAEIGEA